MAKLQDKKIEAKDISEYLATQDDFALELRSLKRASSLGFRVSHGGTYTDPLINKSRQYDLRVSLSKPGTSVHFAIECKALQENCPLLVSCVARAASESFHQRIDLRPNNSPPTHVALVRNSALYPVGQPVGKSTAQVGRTLAGGWSENDATTYEKWMQALASANDLIQHSAIPPALKADSLEEILIIPLLVVPDGMLWSVNYTDTGDISTGPQMVDSVLLYVGRSYEVYRQSFTVSHLHFCTETGLDQFLTTVSQAPAWWASSFQG